MYVFIKNQLEDIILFTNPSRSQFKLNNNFKRVIKNIIQKHVTKKLILGYFYDNIQNLKVMIFYESEEYVFFENIMCDTF